MSPSPVSIIRWLLISRLRNDEFAVMPATRSRRRQILPSSHALMRTWLAVGLPALSGERPDANADEGHSVDIDRAPLARVAAFLRRTTAVIPACCINHVLRLVVSQPFHRTAHVRLSIVVVAYGIAPIPHEALLRSPCKGCSACRRCPCAARSPCKSCCSCRRWWALPSPCRRRCRSLAPQLRPAARTQASGSCSPLAVCLWAQREGREKERSQRNRCDQETCQILWRTRGHPGRRNYRHSPPSLEALRGIAALRRGGGGGPGAS